MAVPCPPPAKRSCSSRAAPQVLAFLVTDNFIVLKRFNNSDAYALAVAVLADRLRGLPGVLAAWPADDVQPSRKERIALQHRLAALGYKVADFDGHFDFELRDASYTGGSGVARFPCWRACLAGRGP
jgi:hypothetical protein